MTYTFAQRTAGLRSSAIRDLLKLTEMSHMLSLAGGLPTPDSFPLPDLRREADRLLGEYGPRVVQYSATDGVVELRQWIADEYTDVLGRPVAVEGEIVVTHGSQQALDLLAKVLSIRAMSWCPSRPPTSGRCRRWNCSSRGSR